MTITYQTIISEINRVPIAYLQDVYNILRSYSTKTYDHTENRNKILEFAGSWSDISEEDFEEIMSDIHSNKMKMFDRDLEL